MVERANHEFMKNGSFWAGHVRPCPLRRVDKEARFACGTRRRRGHQLVGRFIKPRDQRCTRRYLKENCTCPWQPSLDRTPALLTLLQYGEPIRDTALMPCALTQKVKAVCRGPT